MPELAIETNPRSYDLIRPEIQKKLDRYGTHREPVGGFLTAVLSGNLVDACAKADPENLRALPAIVSYIYNQLPTRCWGTPEIVQVWLDPIDPKESTLRRADAIRLHAMLSRPGALRVFDPNGAMDIDEVTITPDGVRMDVS